MSEVPFGRRGGDLFSDVQPRKRRLIADEIYGFVGGVVRANQQVGASQAKFLG
jgi:hypothetical protein